MTNKEKHQELLEYLRKVMKVHVKDKRIKAITVNSANHWQPKMHIEVGRSYRNLEMDAPSETVTAIFESTVFYVCTATRGDMTGFPYLFARPDVRRVVPYEEDED
jgi:hypothetical protein